ncbi:hypothetical protein COCC4DRAFT_52618 [Bipolaris maydis ATCC 48331]|uniref:Cytochrome b561 domain-containing protein n=1 Tax=Cochliobolus heterostrophus (strain C4 / ATCC 48331 / race T) TaxID=665024 RepID=N4X099_COCH4|nr:uncharacterized protein COCC4DRAFT_52618 [Bipolaris maydis ATCC 48331]KAH7562910.1 hypothetical protein BM1_02430 [Bipolaris maydis]ENI01923.1 hypothetical protein COCC4DRAFT_52618 [Bipolaris maydis ATCC 48331]KAJ5028289.1 hypothetical protein J3E73DRAFT_230464 [Bipolaris maydis]KAJ6265447.1 hypothetical protein PSV08DRAFT_366601 [Bipolaris maydis]KAJ6283595.1 hypothetical protein J3E71DRAFT_391179 [Bipolaris maydis]
MFSSIAGTFTWCLLAFSAIFFLSYSSVGFWISGQNPDVTSDYPHGLTAIFSTRTLDSLNQDPHFHDALLSLTAIVAHSSADLGGKFGWEELRSFGTNLTDGVSRIRDKQQRRHKRQDPLANFGASLEDLLSGLGIGGNSSCGLTNILGCLGDSLTDSLGTPALFLGIGLGMGTATGLNLTDAEEASVIANSIVTAYNLSATGINLAAQQLGNGLSRQLLPAVDKGNIPIGLAAYALASGVGNATAVGLGLTKEQFQPSQDSSIVGIAGNLGLGVAMPLVGKRDLKAAIKSWTNNSTVSELIQRLPGFAAAAGNGLGKGMRNGFGLHKKNDNNNKDNNNNNDNNNNRNNKKNNDNNQKQKKRQLQDVALDSPKFPNAVRLFAKGLSQSFIGGSDFSDIRAAMRASLFSSFDVPKMLGSIAAGAGAGIGTGIAVGLDIKTMNSTSTITGDISTEEVQTALAAESFTRNFFSNFLENSSAIQKAKKLITDSPPQAFKRFNAAKAAEGLGRGAIEGVMTAMSSCGGLKNLITGDFPADGCGKVPALGPTQFDDSINGAAVGFARGLSGKATILIADVARNLTGGSKVSENATMGKKRSIIDEDEGVGVDKINPLSPRQAQLPDGAQLPLAIDSDTAQIGAQKIVDSLTCQGVGGIISAAMGFMSTSKAEVKMIETAMGQAGVSLDPKVLRLLPQGPVVVTSGGNSFEINAQEKSIRINGQALSMFTTLTWLHVIFTSLGFLLFLPLYLILGVVWRFSVLIGYPVGEMKNRKWRMGFLTMFAVFGITGIILGIVGMGNTGHFRDTHGILGLISFIITLPTFGLGVARLRSTMPHPSPSAFVGLKGPVGLAKSPQRIYFLSSLTIQLSLILGQFAFLQGFKTLRTISLCIVDAFFSSDSSAGVVSILLVVQMSATALVGIRGWIEQHIAKNLSEGISPRTESSIFNTGRHDTMATFGFDKKDAPAAYNQAVRRRSNFSGKTEDLKGFEDSGIGAPFNFRKEGSIGEQGGVENKERDAVGPFFSPEERDNYQERGIYNPKTGGYIQQQQQQQAMTNGDYYNSLAAYGERRPSSGIFDPQLSPSPRIMPTGPKMSNVSTKDLWPPPMPESERLYSRAKTANSASSRYSRPIDGNVPVRDSFMGFGA